MASKIVPSSQNFFYPNLSKFNEAWLLTDSELETLRNALNSGILSNIEWLFKTPAEYIQSLRFYPFSLEEKLCPTPDQQIILAGVAVQYVEAPTTHHALGFPLMQAGDGTQPIFKVGSFSVTTSNDAFLNYAPYTTIKLYVPFFGFIDLPTDQCLIGESPIEVWLAIDFVSGRGTLYVQNEFAVFSINETQIGIDIPLGLTNASEIQKNIFSTAISAGGSVAQIGAGVATANPFAIAKGATGLLTSSVAMVNGMQQHITSGQTAGGGSSLLAPMQPFVVISKPTKVEIEDFGKFHGFLLGEKRTLSDLTGYTTISQIHLENMHTNSATTDYASEAELDEIETLLKSGVIL